MLDRPLPATGVDIARQDIPQILGRLLIFGQQTDRAARIEAIVRRTDLDALGKALDRVARRHDQAGRRDRRRSTKFRRPRPRSVGVGDCPTTCPPAHVRKLIEEQRRDSVLIGWSNTPLEDARRQIAARSRRRSGAEDPSRPRPCCSSNNRSRSRRPKPCSTNFAQELNLPAAGPIEPKPNDPLGVPYTRLHRLGVDKLTDEDLVRNFQRALQVVARLAVRELGLDDRRPAEPQGEDRPGRASTVTWPISKARATKALKFLDEARKAAEEQKQSTAPWDLEELELRLRRGEPEEFGRLVEHIQEAAPARAGRRPGADADCCIKPASSTPNGRPRGLPPAACHGHGMAVAAAPAAEAGKLWTPGSPEPAAPAAGGGKSGLWVPGMD